MSADSRDSKQAVGSVKTELSEMSVTHVSCECLRQASKEALRLSPRELGQNTNLEARL